MALFLFTATSWGCSLFSAKVCTSLDPLVPIAQCAVKSDVEIHISNIEANAKPLFILFPLYSLAGFQECILFIEGESGSWQSDQHEDSRNSRSAEPAWRHF